MAKNNNSQNKKPQITVVINKDSFKESAEVNAALDKLQSDLTKLLDKHPLVADIQVKVGETFSSIIDDVRKQLSEIDTTQTVVFEGKSKNLNSCIEKFNNKILELKNNAIIEIQLDPTQVAKVVENIANEMNRQFKELGGGERALAAFNQSMSAINEAADNAREAMARVGKAQDSINKNAKPTTTGVNSIAKALDNLETQLQGFEDETDFDELSQAADRAATFISTLASKLNDEKVSLIGDIDVEQTASNIADSIRLVTIKLAREYQNVTVKIAGDLNEFKTAENIARTISNSLDYQLHQRGAYVSLDYNGITVSGDAVYDVVKYERALQELKAEFRQISRESFGELVTKWNSELNQLSFDGIINSLSSLNTILESVETKFNSVIELARNSGLQQSTVVDENKKSKTKSKSKKKQEEDIAVSEIDSVPVKVTVTTEQIASAINAAINKIEASSLNRIPVNVAVVGLTEAINEALSSTNTADPNGAGIPLPFDATGIHAAVNAEIEALNNNPGTLQKIKLEFDISDLTTVVEEGTKAIDALQKAAQKAKPKQGGGGGNIKQNNELRRFRIDNKVTDAETTMSLMKPKEIKALEASGVDVTPYYKLKQAIQEVSDALKGLNKNTKEKDKADVLNGVTMKKNIEIMKRAEQAAKAFYNTYFNIDTTADETRVDNIIKDAERERNKVTPDALKLLKAEKVDVSRYNEFKKAIKDVKEQLEKARNATTQKDKADILNGETMKNNILILREATKEFKAFYKENSSIFDTQLDSNKYKQAAQAYTDAMEMASKWGLNDKNNPLSHVTLGGKNVSSGSKSTVAEILRKQAEDVEKKMIAYRNALAQPTQPAEERIIKLNQELDLAVKKLVDMRKAAQALGEVDFANLTSDFADTFDVRLQKIKNQLNAFQGYQKDAGFENDDIKNLDDYNAKLTETFNKWTEFKKNSATLKPADAEAALNSIAKNMDLLDAYIAKIQTARTGYANQAKEQNKIQQEQARINDYVDKYEKRIKRFPKLWEEVQRIQQAIINGQGTSASFKEDIDDVIMTSRGLGIETENIFTKIWERVGFNFRSMIASQGIMLVTSSLRSLYNNVKDLDTAMTELKKVTDGSASTYLKFLDEASNRAQKLGASLVNVVSATSDFARLGYSIADASMLSDAATIYLNVGDDVDDIDQATKSIISTMQGFGIETSKVMNIVDEFNEVSNKYASSAGDIGEITQRSAAAMKAAGSTLEETIALGVTANTVAQDADTVGTALKTMSMRLRSSRSDLEAAGEDTEGMADSVSKLRGEILALSGVDIMLNEDTFKSPYQMLIEIGKAWDKLTDVGQANITELLFGKRQANIGSAILQNVDLAESILKTAGNSAGSALKENEVYLSSIQGKLSKIQATWESLSNHTLDSGLVKGLLDGANAVLKVLDAIVDNLGLIPPLIGAGVTALTKTTGKNMPPYREIEKQALGCWRSSSRQCETSKSWNQLKLADLGGAGNGRRVTNIIYYSGQVGKPGKNMRDEVC